MPAKRDVKTLFRKNLGKETADAILKKIDTMVKKKATAAQIEKAIIADISAEIEKAVTSTVIAKIGPITPIKVKPIQVDIKSKITPPITVSPKINTGVQVKVGPPLMTRGSK